MNPVRAVIFDLDGTLLDTLDDLADAANGALAALGLPEHPVDAYRHFVGDGVRTLIARALPAPKRDPDTMAACLELTKSNYASGWHAKTRPYPGVETALDHLAQVGLPLAVLSNKPHEFTVRMVRHYFGDHRFAHVLGAVENVPLKPDPASAVALARKLETKPASIALVGDSDVDVKTALAAGMLAVGAGWGFRGADELRAAGAAMIIDTPEAVGPALT